MKTWKCPKCGANNPLAGHVESGIMSAYVIDDHQDPCNCGVVWFSKEWKEAWRKKKKAARA